MKGLEEYIAVHGKHFTEELVKAAIYNRWSSLEIDRSSRNLVYYNVSSATLGDMTFLVNYCSKVYGFSKVKSIKHTLYIIGDVNNDGYAFNQWLLDDMDIDLKNYI